MSTITHAGSTFALGSVDGAYAIWARGREQAAPIRTYAVDETGWRAAWAQFVEWDSEGQAPQLPGLVPMQRHSPHAQVPHPQSRYSSIGQPAVQEAPSGNVLATAGGVIGIVGAVLSLIPFLGIFIGLSAGLVAVIFGSIGLGSGGPAHVGRGMAVTGVLLGLLTVVFRLLFRV